MTDTEALPPPLADLVAAVDVRFADTRTVEDWADPLADDSPFGRREPREEEYSRVSHPERYAIVGERADAWVAELLGRGLADVVDVPPPSELPPGRQYEGGDGWLLRPGVRITRLRVLRPRRHGALPLALGTTTWPDDPGQSLVVGVGTPFVERALVPDCGCDACDSGSADLLRQLDDSLLPVLDGSLRLRLEGGRLDGASAEGAWSGTVYRGDARERGRALGGVAHEYAGVPWDEAWPVRPAHPFMEG